MVFDLDPPDDDADGHFPVIRAGALALGELLRELGLAPLRDDLGLARAARRGAAAAPRATPTRRAPRPARIAERLAERAPDGLTTAWRKEKRGGRVLVDTARNTYGQTTVAPYAVRALPGAPVATPLAWDELEDPGAAPAPLDARDACRRGWPARRPVGADRRRGAAAAATGAGRAMIAPIFKLDSRERWRPQPVETAEWFATIGGRPVVLDALPPEGGRMDFPANLQDPADTPVAGYHRVVAAAHLHWHHTGSYIALGRKPGGDWRDATRASPATGVLGARLDGGRPVGYGARQEGFRATGGRPRGRGRSAGRPCP